MTKFGVRVVVAVNRFVTDTAAEIELVRTAATEAGAFAAVGRIIGPKVAQEPSISPTQL